MQIWVLQNRHEQFMGAYETVDQAMEAVYWMSVYQAYRGYSGDIPPIIWRDNNGVRYSGYRSPDGHKSPQYRGVPDWGISQATVPYDGGFNDEKMRVWAAPKFKSYADWLTIYSNDAIVGVHDE